MVKCNKCGKSVSDNIKFCPDCGAKIKREEPKKEIQEKGKIPLYVVYIILSVSIIVLFILALFGSNVACKGSDNFGGYTRFPSNDVCNAGEVSTFALGYPFLIFPLAIFVSICGLILTITNLVKKRYGYELYASISGSLTVFFTFQSEYGWRAFGMLIPVVLMLIFALLEARTIRKK